MDRIKIDDEISIRIPADCDEIQHVVNSQGVDETSHETETTDGLDANTVCFSRVSEADTSPCSPTGGSDELRTKDLGAVVKSKPKPSIVPLEEGISQMNLSGNRLTVRPDKNDGSTDWEEYIAHFCTCAQLGGMHLLL